MDAATQQTDNSVILPRYHRKFLVAIEAWVDHRSVSPLHYMTDDVNKDWQACIEHSSGQLEQRWFETFEATVEWCASNTYHHSTIRETHNTNTSDTQLQTEDILSHQALLTVATLPTNHCEMCERLWAAFKLGQQYQKILDNALPLMVVSTPSQDEHSDELYKQCANTLRLNKIIHNNVVVKAKDNGKVAEMKNE